MIFGIGFGAKVLVEGHLQMRLLWEAARNFPCLRWRECQPAPRWTCCWMRPSPSAIMALSQDSIFKMGKKLPYSRNCRQRRKEWEYVSRITLQTPRSVKESKEVLQAPELRFPWFVVQTVVKQLCPYSPWRTMVEQRSTTGSCLWNPPWSRWICPKESVTPWGTHIGAVNTWVSDHSHNFSSTCTAAGEKVENWEKNYALD